MRDVEALRGKHVVFLSWRDTRHPEGGGAEKYLEMVAAGLVELGARVTIFTAAHPAAPPDETVDGIRFVRRGGRFGVYLRGMLALLRGSLGTPDVVVDVLNGLPFWSRLVTRAPVVVLVHHVHREQWPVAVPGRLSSVGWWLESRLAPFVYRRDQYVAVSRATRTELRSLGVRGPRIAVVHNGSERAVPVSGGKAPVPTLAVVGRLVPHKQVEHAIDTALALREELPGLRLHVVGSGWWEGVLHEYARTREAGSTVVFEGHVDERRKHEIYESSWVLLLPSIKEGWGLVIPEAGMHATPTVAYRSAGGTRESVADGESGLLVDDQAGFEEATRRLLTEPGLRTQLGVAARERCMIFSWDQTRTSFALVLLAAMQGRRIDAQDPEEGDLGRARLAQ
ncbi:glycosyltransferase family 4 protein [Nocardioides sp.]|uniref:glycosyltransferase family 4 protein n=1 Tax=Nocardioides sp. TaxID=35761 RepID=UPI001A34E519|nr:glycosyltransferase family 4 protein [Nocardioides sp.]MBJ7355929.1 glycosyltransferase family 4 protein [Nocardioides sp.]